MGLPIFTSKVFEGPLFLATLQHVTAQAGLPAGNAENGRSHWVPGDPTRTVLTKVGKASHGGANIDLLIL